MLQEEVHLVRRVSGEDDVTAVRVLPSVAYHGDETLTPMRMIRIRARFLVGVREYPGKWWMGEILDGRLVVWGSYGSLEDAAAAH